MIPAHFKRAAQRFVLILPLGLFLLPTSLKPHFSDFLAVYSSSRLFWSGENPYDSTTFVQYKNATAISAGEQQSPKCDPGFSAGTHYPPVFFEIMAPVCIFSYPLARHLWNILSVLFFLIALYACANLYGFNAESLLATGVMVYVSALSPGVQSFLLWQSPTSLFLMLAMVGIWAFVRRRWALSGVLLGLACFNPITLAWILCALFAKRPPKRFIWPLVAVLCGQFLPFFSGWQSPHAFYEWAGNVRQWANVCWQGDQEIWANLYYGSRWFYPWIQKTSVGFFEGRIFVSLLPFVLAAVFYRKWRGFPLPLIGAWVLALSPLVAGFSLDYDALFTIPLFFVMGQRWMAMRHGHAWSYAVVWLCFSSFLKMMVPANYWTLVMVTAALLADHFLVGRKAALSPLAGSRLLLAVGGLAAGFLIAELMVHVIPNHYAENIQRTEYMKERNIIQFLYGEADPDIQIGYHNQPNIRARFKNKEFDTEVRFNHLGFRGPEFALMPAPAQRRMMVLGDSLAFGWGVEENQTFEGVMNVKRADWDVLNLGVSGFGTRQEWGFLKRYGPMLHPRDVIVAFYPNDPADCATPPWKYYRWKAAPFKKQRFYLPGFLKQWKPSVGPPYCYWHQTDAAALQACQMYFLTMKAWCDKNHVALHVLYIPFRDELIEKPATGYRRLMADFCEKNKIDWMDATPAIQNLNNPQRAYFRIDDHMTPLGHSVVAQVLIEHLK